MAEPTKPHLSRRALLGATTAATALVLAGRQLPASALESLDELGGFRLGSSPDDVRRSHGSPTQIDTNEGQGDPQWRYPGVVIQFKRETSGTTVRVITLLSPAAGATGTGVQIGATLDRVRADYGPEIVDFNLGGFTVPLNTTRRLHFGFSRVGRATKVTSIALSRYDCSTCRVPTETVRDKDVPGKRF